MVTLSVVFRGSPYYCFKKEQNKGGGKPSTPKSPDFGAFALEILPKTLRIFRSPSAARKERNKGESQGGAEEYH